MRINTGTNFWNFPIEAIRKREPEAVFVADLAILEKNKNWSKTPVAVYYVPNLRGAYKNHYFGVWQEIQSLGEIKTYITDATCVTEHIWKGIACRDEIIFSRWVHDFRSFSFGVCSVDGGPNYTRLVGNINACEDVDLRIIDGKFVPTFKGRFKTVGRTKETPLSLSRSVV